MVEWQESTANTSELNLEETGETSNTSWQIVPQSIVIHSDHLNRRLLEHCTTVWSTGNTIEAWTSWIFSEQHMSPGMLS